MSEMALIDVTAALRAACRAAGSEAAWAQRHGVTKQYVNKVLNGETPPGKALLDALRLRKVTRYVPTNGGQQYG